MFKPFLVFLFLLSFFGSASASDIKFDSGILMDKIYAPFIEYKLYVPNSVDRNSNGNKLLVMLHGCEQTATELFTGSRIKDHADKNGFIVLLPEQTSLANPYRCWNWFNPLNQVKASAFTLPNEPYNILKLVGVVSREYGISGRDSVFVTGMSAGAAMANIIASCYPERVGAVGMHHGVAFGAANFSLTSMKALESLFQEGGLVSARTSARLARTCALTLTNPLQVMGNHLPAIIFQGADGYMTYDHAVNLETQFKRYNLVLGDSSSYVSTVVEKLDDSGYDYEKHLTHNEKGDLVVERYKIHGLHHAWSGGADNMQFFDPNGPDATLKMVEFFQKFGL